MKECIENIDMLICNLSYTLLGRILILYGLCVLTWSFRNMLYYPIGISTQQQISYSYSLIYLGER